MGINITKKKLFIKFFYFLIQSPKSTDDDETDTFNQIRFFATQSFQIEKGHTSKIIDNLVKDLDAELHFVYCRIAALLEQLPDASMILIFCLNINIIYK